MSDLQTKSRRAQYGGLLKFVPHLPIDRFVLCVLSALIFCLMAADCQAQNDVVITKRTGKNASGSDTLKRKGTITQWKGLSLTIFSSGAEREIDNDDIVEVKTAWSEDYIAALNAIRTGQTQEAIPKFQSALNQESRAWAQNIIRSKLMDALLSLEQYSAAVKQFLLILSDDPQTRLVHLAPLPWTGTGTQLNQQAQQWIATKDPTVQLIGASWLLVGPDRERAINVLDQLTRDIDPNIKNLAIAQLWRSRTNVNAKQTVVWQNIVDKMPRSLRAGPYLVLAEAQTKTGQNEQALINLMKVPILYPEQKSLAAAALYRTGKLLSASGKPTQSQTIFNELKKRYPQTIWAQKATQSLQLK